MWRGEVEEQADLSHGIRQSGWLQWGRRHADQVDEVDEVDIPSHFQVVLE